VRVALALAFTPTVGTISRASLRVTVRAP
jgi:hypothetical protein